MQALFAQTPSFQRQVWLVLAVFVLFAAAFAAYVAAEKRIDRAHEARHRAFLLVDEMRQSSDDLTRMARTYVVIGDQRFRRHYQEILDIRNGVAPRPQGYEGIYWDHVLDDDTRPAPPGAALPLLELMRQAGFTATELDRLTETKSRSDALAQTEFAAMALADEARARGDAAARARAIAMLHDAAYHAAKAAIMRPIAEFHRMVALRTRQTVAAAEDHAVHLRILFVLLGAVLVALLWNVRRSLHAILGTGVDELHASIGRLGRGEFGMMPDVPAGMEDSVIGRLARTQAALATLDAERTVAETALREGGRRLNEAQRVAKVGNWELDLTTGLLTWSDEIYRIFEIDKDRFGATYEAFLAAIHPEDREAVNAAYRRSLATHEPYAITHRLLMADGRVKYVHEQCEFVCDETRRPLRAFGTVQDITEQRQIELELERYRKHLEALVEERTADLAAAKNAAEAANRAKSVFLANMSHELRTPLNAILGFTELLLRDAGLSEAQRRDLVSVNRAGQHLLSLVNDVLEISRIEAGRTEVQNQPFDLDALLTTIEEMIRLRGDAKGLAFAVERAGALPRVVRGDAHHLRQVLINLLGNAVKYTERGHVVLWLTAEGERIRFEVSDTGIGISAAEQGCIFRPFYQTESGIALGEGTGLGLAISQQFVRLMGGEITVRSAPGQGATFAFAIPLPAVDEQSAAAPVSARVCGLEPGQPAWRVLVAEDQPDSRDLAVRLLESVGFAVRAAGDGEQAVKMFVSWHPHFIWMDMRMPVMDGYEATRRIRAMSGGAEVKIAALTASAFEEDRAAILEAGCDDMVRKPIEPSRLFEVMARLLGVRLRYAESVVGAGPVVDFDLGRLPAPVREALGRAAVALDKAAVVEQAERLRAEFPVEVEAILALAQDYRLDRLAALCGQG